MSTLATTPPEASWGFVLTVAVLIGGVVLAAGVYVRGWGWRS